jgi:hypothetical protein
LLPGRNPRKAPGWAWLRNPFKTPDRWSAVADRRSTPDRRSAVADQRSTLIAGRLSQIGAQHLIAGRLSQISAQFHDRFYVLKGFSLRQYPDVTASRRDCAEKSVDYLTFL